MLKKVLLVLGLIVGVFAVYIAVLPSEYSVARSIEIDAPPEAVFPHVNDLKKWESWSPWAKRDPNMQMTYEGAESGVGSISKWSGNEDVGVGQMRIEQSAPPKEIEIKLEFKEPFPGTSDVGFEFAQAGNGTMVTWSFAGEQGYIERLMFSLMGLDMDQMIGADYEKGLASLKKVVEAQTQ